MMGPAVGDNDNGILLLLYGGSVYYIRYFLLINRGSHSCTHEDYTPSSSAGLARNSRNAATVKYGVAASATPAIRIASRPP